MLLNTIRRNWATVCSGLAITSFVIMSILWLGSTSVGELVEAEMRARGTNFSRLLLTPQGHVDSFLTGIARDPDAETTDPQGRQPSPISRASPSSTGAMAKRSSARAPTDTSGCFATGPAASAPATACHSRCSTRPGEMAGRAR
jgi:hypothetical protein